MTRAHMHNKACEMWPKQKPVMVQNNTDYCQIKGRLHSTRTLCIATTQGAQPIWAAAGRGLEEVRGWPPSTAALTRTRRFHISVGTGSEWISQGRWDTLNMASFSHAAFQIVILHGQGEFFSRTCQIVCPDWNKPILPKISNNNVLPHGRFQKGIFALAVLNVSSDAVSVIHLQSNCRKEPCPIQLPSPLQQMLQLLADIQRTSGPLYCSTKHPVSVWGTTGQQVNKFPFYGVSPTKQESTPFP